MLDDGISGLIGTIYSGIQCPDDWDAVLDALIAHTDSRFLMVSTVDLTRQEYGSSRFYGADGGRFLDGIAEYGSERYKQDPTLKFALRHPDAGAISLRSTLADHHSNPEDREYALWVESQLDAGDSQVFYTPPIDDLIFGVSLHKRAGDIAYTDDELRIFSLLFRHMENAVRMAMRPALPDGAEALLFVDRRGLVRHANDAALSAIDRGDLLLLSNGRLRTANRADQARLDGLLRSALHAVEHGGAGGGMTVRWSGRRASPARPLLLTVKPMPHGAPPMHLFGPMALVRIIDPCEKARPDRRWASLFGLTPAETRLAMALLDEENSLRHAADSLTIAYATARVQLASIFAKTGVRTQGQLIRLLGRLQVGLLCVLPVVSGLNGLQA